MSWLIWKMPSLNFLNIKMRLNPAALPSSSLSNLLTMKEYQCLLQMLCPDFPMDLTQKAARIVLMDDAMDCLMSFSDFLYAFQIQFYYSEFLDCAAAVYQELLTGKSINTVIVPTSRSATPFQRQPYSDSTSLEGVEAPQFYQCLENLCERDHHSSSPPMPLIGEILNSAPRLTFYGFLMALSKNTGIKKSIGALPDKADLLVDEVLDKELDKIVAQLSACSITHPATTSLLPPSRDITRVASPKKTLSSRRRPDLESDGSTEEAEDSSEN
ncbi:centriolar satellite-associated tubulin polyglutamylase complex regulator 1 isoform X5 [Hyla sarda]|uniref:centriolar satellite-associated tubulin polyglutamylase complex regulator 1 isoform X5 n=1 Tax=Hyla sarda TaxID=327740 RepID=UPI0024C45B88|nr:centriolar satellite-associated tubulin polyglutamylase complex regulator 1 isoform X5 [Hyla sarda]XP_056382437.1 centriolar satellite-associated tubulin polyglutamylase complex regulator 1 isoform X5 [Hyla sarda]XP_056382438.1 centriolar satellite-associated tubulin polyglutamylase complex regulator 1 isoform X5 [Hyla sarda]